MFLNHKRIFPIIMIVIMIFGMLSTVYATPSSWAEDFIKSMLLEDLSSEALLNPDYMQQPITREEFAELTVRLYAKANNIDLDDIPQWNPFADTDNIMVAKAYNIGIVSGTGVDSRDRKLFSPNKQVTRQEIAVMLVKELNILGKDISARYNMKFSDDADISSWAYDAVAFATESGIISGVGSDRVAPKENATREVAMVLVNKIALKYNYINNASVNSLFSYGNATKAYGFWIPKGDATQLRAIKSDSGIKYIVSHLVDSYTPDIAKQQTDLINILVNSDAVSYNALLTMRTLILESYDIISKKYKPADTVYINLQTGETSKYSIGTPHLRFDVDTEITLEYIK